MRDQEKCLFFIRQLTPPQEAGNALAVQFRVFLMIGMLLFVSGTIHPDLKH